MHTRVVLVSEDNRLVKDALLEDMAIIASVASCQTLISAILRNGDNSEKRNYALSLCYLEGYVYMEYIMLSSLIVWNIL